MEAIEAGTASASPTAVVERFLDLLRSDTDAAADLLAAEVIYENKGMSTMRGRERVRGFFDLANRFDTGFEVYVHAISTDGSTVMTERTDVLRWGRMRVQFWVCGRFDVADGRIAVWRDYFDYLAVLRATARGLLGIVLPAARAKPPSGDWRGGITQAKR